MQLRKELRLQQKALKDQAKSSKTDRKVKFADEKSDESDDVDSADYFDEDEKDEDDEDDYGSEESEKEEIKDGVMIAK